MQIREYTMADYIIAIANENITMKSLQHQTMIGSDTRLIINDESILRKYRKDLEEDCFYVTFSNAEKRKYAYKPWLFCLDTFGLSDLWRELLDLNQIRSFTQFDHDKIKVFSPSYLRKLKVILNLEEEIIDQKSAEMTEAIKEATLA